MTHGPRPGRRPVDDVIIASSNPETLEGLHRYLTDAGIAARCVRHMAECADAVRPSTVAFVLFPDDFRWEKVIVTLATLAEKAPNALPMLVTSRPDRYERLTNADAVLVVPRPVWGSTILDAIRAHIEQRGAR